MTREDIIRMAKECGNWSGQTIEMNDVGLERFAKLIRAAIEQAERPQTHSEECWRWHHQCAVTRIERGSK